MLKLTGAFLLIAAGLCIGLVKAGEMKRHERILAALIRLIQWMKTRLRYSSEPMGDLLARAAAEGDFSPLSVPAFSRSLPFAAGWQGFVEQTDLPAADRLLLRRFGEELGRTDLEGQLAHMELYGELLEERRRLAAEEFRKKGRVPVVLWTAGAAAAVLLLL